MSAALAVPPTPRTLPSGRNSNSRNSCLRRSREQSDQTRMTDPAATPHAPELSPVPHVIAKVEIV